MAGKALLNLIVPVTLKVIVSAPAAAFASMIACRSEPDPLLLVLVTVIVPAWVAGGRTDMSVRGNPTSKHTLRILVCGFMFFPPPNPKGL